MSVFVMPIYGFREIAGLKDSLIFIIVIIKLASRRCSVLLEPDILYIQIRKYHSKFLLPNLIE